MIDGGSSTVVATVPVGSPLGVAANPSTNSAYVINRDLDSVAVIAYGFGVFLPHVIRDAMPTPTPTAAATSTATATPALTPIPQPTTPACGVDYGYMTVSGLLYGRVYLDGLLIG